MTKEQIAAHNAKVNRQIYVIMWIINAALLLASLVFAVAFLINVFKGRWPYAVGFAVLTYGVWYVFRQIPVPETETEEQRKRKEIIEIFRRGV